MSDLTLPGDSPPEVVDRYRAALTKALGDADPYAVLRAMPAWCADVLSETALDRLRMPEAEGKWSVADVVHHLADSDLVWSNRLRRVLAEDRPRIPGYDQDRWADRLGYASQPPDLSVGLFQAVRAANLRLLDAASEHDLQRVGLHGERGEESIADMVRLYAGHDLVHRAQIERILTGTP
ncbi:MAG: DinB family protein [Bacteroidota bacterium]